MDDDPAARAACQPLALRQREVWPTFVAAEKGPRRWPLLATWLGILCAPFGVLFPVWSARFAYYALRARP